MVTDGGSLMVKESFLLLNFCKVILMQHTLTHTASDANSGKFGRVSETERRKRRERANISGGEKSERKREKS